MSTSLFLKVHPITFLPSPGDGETVTFGSLCINANDSQFIKDSTQLGYRNPPEVKFQMVPSDLKPVAESTGYLPVTSDYRSPGWTPPITSSSTSITPSPNKDHKFDHTHSEASSTSVLGQGQYANIPPGSESQYYNTQMPNTATYSVTVGGPQSLTSVGNTDGSESSTQFGSLSQHKYHKYSRQKSTPTDASLSSEMTASATNKSNQLTVPSHNPVIAAVPLTDQPTPEGSWVPSTAGSKFGKANLNYLKNKLQHKKEVIQTVVQTGGAGAHSHSWSDYINAETVAQMIQGSSDSTNKSTFGKSDLTSLRDKLEKAKKERERNVVAVVNKTSDYHNLSEISSYISENPMMMKNLPDKKPVASCRTKAPTTNSGHSASSTASSKAHFKLWQCAHCQTVNEAHHNSCMHCKLPRGRQADRSAVCEFCQLMIFIPARGEATDICCPRCKQAFESIF